jgi:hypothetical protein
MRKAGSHCCVTLPISVLVCIGEAPGTFGDGERDRGSGHCSTHPTAVSAARSGKVERVLDGAPRGRWRSARGAASQTFGSDPNANPVETA